MGRSLRHNNKAVMAAQATSIQIHGSVRRDHLMAVLQAFRSVASTASKSANGRQDPQFRIIWVEGDLPRLTSLAKNTLSVAWDSSRGVTAWASATSTTTLQQRGRASILPKRFLLIFKELSGSRSNRYLLGPPKKCWFNGLRPTSGRSNPSGRLVLGPGWLQAMSRFHLGFCSTILPLFWTSQYRPKQTGHLPLLSDLLLRARPPLPVRQMPASPQIHGPSISLPKADRLLPKLPPDQYHGLKVLPQLGSPRHFAVLTLH